MLPEVLEKLKEFKKNSTVWFLSKNACFLGVNSNLTVQNMVKFFLHIFSFEVWFSPISIKQKKTGAFYHTCVLRYLAVKIQRFFEAPVILSAPL
jgi:hypothetical protein